MHLVEQVGHGAECIDAHIVPAVSACFRVTARGLQELEIREVRLAEVQALNLVVHRTQVVVKSWAIGIAENGVRKIVVQFFRV